MGLFDFLQQQANTASQAFSSVGQRVSSGVSTSFSDPKRLVGDVLNGIAAPGAAIIKGGSKGLEALGKATHNEDWVRTGQEGQRVTHSIAVETERDPVSSLQVLGGGALVVGGVVTGGAVSGPGVALASKGIAKISGRVIADEVAYQQHTTPPITSHLPANPIAQAVANQAKAAHDWTWAFLKPAQVVAIQQRAEQRSFQGAESMNQ